jgi:hypothetical protein
MKTSLWTLALGLVIAPAAPGAGAFGSPVVVTGLDTGEPGIDVALDGTIYVKSGPICTQGIGCSADRELLDFQSVTLDGAGRANAVWTRSIDGVSDTEIRFARQ